MRTLPDAPAPVDQQPPTWDDLRAGSRGLWRRHTQSTEALVPVLGVGIAVVQSVALSLLALRGHWYADDLDNVAAADGAALNPEYLGSRLNDHLVPGLRLAYWVFANLVPFDYGVTVVLRGALQLAATLLLLRLLVLLLGARPLVLVALAGYAASPLLMPSFMSLSSAVNLVPSHVAGFALLIAVVRWSGEGGVRWLAGAALALAVTLAFWEKSGLIVLTAAALLAGPLRPGLSARRSLRDAWPLGVALAVPVVVFVVAYARAGPPEAGGWPGLLTQGRLVARAAWEVLAPAAVAGPWRWSTGTPPPFGLADPPVVASIAGAAVLAAGVAAAWRWAPDALPLWVAVAGYVVATTVSVSVGRMEAFGTVFLHHYHYWSDLSIPLVLAVALSLRGWLDVRRAGRPPQRRWTGALVAAWLVAATVSHAGFAASWAEQPSRAWLDTLSREVGQREGTVHLYDTAVPSDVMTVLAGRRNLSDVLPLAGLPVVFDAPGTDPLLVGDDGSLRAAQLEVWARSVQGTPGCGHLVQGRDSVVVRLDDRLPRGEWFARLGYLANPDAPVRVELADGPVRTARLTGSPTWPAGLLTATMRTTTAARGDRLVITGERDDINLCVDDVAVGQPRAVG